MKSDVARIRALLDGGAAVDGPNDVRALSRAGRAHMDGCLAGPRHQSARRSACDGARLGARDRRRCGLLPRGALGARARSLGRVRRCRACFLAALPCHVSAALRGAEICGRLCARQHGMTPLHCAAFTGAADVVALLLDRGARVGQPDGVRPSRSRCQAARSAHAGLLTRRALTFLLALCPPPRSAAGRRCTSARRRAACLLRSCCWLAARPQTHKTTRARRLTTQPAAQPTSPCAPCCARTPLTPRPPWRRAGARRSRAAAGAQAQAGLTWCRRSRSPRRAACRWRWRCKWRLRPRWRLLLLLPLPPLRLRLQPR